MNSKKALQLYKVLEQNLTEKKFLRRIKLSKKYMLQLLTEKKWKQKMQNEAEGLSSLSCNEICRLCQDTLSELSPTPEQGWLHHIYVETIAVLFPENYTSQTHEQYKKGSLFYLQTLRTFLKFQENENGFSQILNIERLQQEEIQNCSAKDEYLTFIQFFSSHYLIEFMRIGKEITPFNTIGHISGVHFTALHVARQLIRAGLPVDLALVSGAAAGHDIGKFGCKEAESKRIPYLHYYYTDHFLRKNEMPLIAHIATNHSTWDLELENLSVESLILIYSDFRVKSTRNEDGEESVHFYSLKEAFEVILNKLDNVDEAKTIRYRKVYMKLQDFENYMSSVGVNVNLQTEQMIEQEKKDVALLRPDEVIDGLKYLAIEHNINLMNRFNNEADFGNLLEAARSEKQWKNMRIYLSILEEYSTYMTQKQKLMTLHFLYELLTHKEGDIRRQTADLMGSIIAKYDEEYRKELPEGVTLNAEDMDSYQLWDYYLEKVIYPDHKVTDQHRRWIGYTVKIMLHSVLENAVEEDEKLYLEEFLQFYHHRSSNDATVFILLDSMLDIPLRMCTLSELELLSGFVRKVAVREPLEIQVAALRFAKYLAEFIRDQEQLQGLCPILLEVVHAVQGSQKNAAIEYLQDKIQSALHSSKSEELVIDEEITSEIFLENLKVGTPWVLKAVNIELLLDQVIRAGSRDEILHVATHLSNLIKVSEIVTVRHTAGEGLLQVIQLLPLDQRNELVIELTKGLEIGEYQFSKYIPKYLGPLALYLHPNELDEFIHNMGKLLESTSDKVCAVTLDTVGELVKYYDHYWSRFRENREHFENRKQIMLGMLLRGLANYNRVISQEAFMVIGQELFGSRQLNLDKKYEIFQYVYKKMLTLIVDQKEYELEFYTNAAALNHIYRFISEYHLKRGAFKISRPDKIAFFPGTFDPFSLSHKGIVTSIRNMGFEVYLALDEFSWSKKTQPRMIRRKIITMSVADERDVYIFPDDRPINISNPLDLKGLKNCLDDENLYIVVGSDVIVNASSYKVPPVENSIHTLNHVVFRRESLVEGDRAADNLAEAYEAISGKIVELTLPVHLEDISSTRIRENIDSNRDISNLIDSVAQNYIYDNSLYLREPQYKNILHTKSIQLEPLTFRGQRLVDEQLADKVAAAGHNVPSLKQYLDRPQVRAAVLRDKSSGGEVCGFMAVNQVDTAHLYEEFQSLELASYLRKKATGQIMIIGSIYYDQRRLSDVIQLILTETLSQALQEDITYAVYRPQVDLKTAGPVLTVLKRQGFQEIVINGKETGIYEVDMKSPISLFQNMDTVLKDPFGKDEKVLEAIERAHNNMQDALTRLYPGNVVISFNSGIMHHKMINMITDHNGVPSEPLKVRKLGPYMCVPFGKILRGMVVPNTVTKALHTEKMFEPDLRQFTIKEYPNYSPIKNQVKTIQSFNRPVILVDDLLHKGYRMKELDPVLKEAGVEVDKLVVGLLSGRGRDLMTLQGRTVESAYFIPNLRTWFVESSLYPFIGGDGVQREEMPQSGLLPSINLILPYAAPSFLAEASNESVYQFSKICLDNARNIFLALEKAYQNLFERKLTLKRLSEVVIAPRIPDGGGFMNYDLNLAPSGYLLNGLERLIRLENIIK